MYVGQLCRYACTFQQMLPQICSILLGEFFFLLLNLILNIASAFAVGIPQVIVMTKVDEACPLVKNDIRKLYTSKKIKEKVCDIQKTYMCFTFTYCTC